MVNLCIVNECNNSSALTMKKCIMFKLPQDELHCKNWLINCGRQDLLEKPTVRRYVCSDHFEDKMYSNPDRTVLLPTAVPTDFSLIFKEHACSTSCEDTSISDPLLFNNSVATSTPTKQKESISITYNTPDISIGDLKNIVNNQNTKLERTEIINKLREKLDNVVEDRCWELDDVFVEHNYSSAPDSTVFECVVYYLSGYITRRLQKTTKCEVCLNCLKAENGISSNTAAELVNIKTRGNLNHPNHYLFKILQKLETCFMKHADSVNVFCETYEDFFQNFDFKLTFICQEHRSEILTTIFVMYITMRMRQYSYMANQQTKKQNKTKKKIIKIS